MNIQKLLSLSILISVLAFANISFAGYWSGHSEAANFCTGNQVHDFEIIKGLICNK